MVLILFPIVFLQDSRLLIFYSDLLIVPCCMDQGKKRCILFAIFYESVDLFIFSLSFFYSYIFQFPIRISFTFLVYSLKSYFAPKCGSAQWNLVLVCKLCDFLSICLYFPLSLHFIYVVAYLLMLQNISEFQMSTFSFS